MKENVYVNVSISNTIPGTVKPATFAATSSNKPYVKDMENYQIGVVRFRVPTWGFPVFTFRQQDHFISYTGLLGSSTPVLLKYLSTQNGDGFIDADGPIFSISQYVQMLNRGLAAAFNQYKIQFPADLTLTCPWIEYTRQTQLTVYANYGEYASEDLRVVVSPVISRLLRGQTFTYPPGTAKIDESPTLQIRVNPTHPSNVVTKLFGLSPTQCIEMVDQFPSTASWYDPIRIVVTSGRIPISSESTVSDSIVSASFSNVLTDFEIIRETAGVSSTGYVQYVTDFSGVRLYDIKGRGALTTMDFQMSTINQFGETQPIFLPYNTDAEIKLTLRRRRE